MSLGDLLEWLAAALLATAAFLWFGLPAALATAAAALFYLAQVHDDVPLRRRTKNTSPGADQ